MDRVHKDTPITCIIQGGALGADYLGKYWALLNEIPTIEYRANWKKYGKKAGILRNAQMLEQGSPDLVIGFPGGDGTADMVKRSYKAGVRVLDIARGVAISPQPFETFDFRTILRSKKDDPPDTKEDA